AQPIVGERANAAAPVAATTDANAVDRAVAQQVARAVANHAGVQGKPLILRLTPPELGTVRVEILERAGQITARIHAEDAAVRTAIERFLPQLKQDLRANDAPIRDVVLADAYQQQGQQERDRSQESGERGQRATRGSAFALDGTSGPDALPASARALGGHVADDMVDARA
ncbi:MAG: flagellar hook-length control protein FliK, partial [Planctomycetes bacterium]|nr:flagellar hook-length control protein FliK [Planctomycetota bacterium]